MQKREYDIMNELEESFYWFQLKSLLIQKLITKYIPGQKGTWLDIGCGTGGLTKIIELNTSCKVIGLDSNDWALKHASKRLANAQKGSAELLPFKNRSIQSASLFDVLYHRDIESVEVSLREASRVLSHGGLLFVTDCAYSFLYGSHDKHMQGARRFTLTEMVRLLNNQKFEIVWSSYFFAWLLPAVVLKRVVMDKVFPPKHSDVFALPTWANNLFLWVGKIELLIMKIAGRLPYGLSLVIVARKR
jgi:ubiquinone/menaquinone biosynthesis C-methylase UbiE